MFRFRMAFHIGDHRDNGPGGATGTRAVSPADVGKGPAAKINAGSGSKKIDSASDEFVDQLRDAPKMIGRNF